MHNLGPIYILAKHSGMGLVTGVPYYTLAPHGTVLVKVRGVSKWTHTAMSKELFEINVKHGHLVRVER